MRRCTDCILPENYPKIEFNENGVCSFCLTYQKATYKGEEQLKRLLGSHRSSHPKYDCVVGISGGRDSAYTLYYLTKKHNLRPLAYTADNGFIPIDTKRNIEKITNTLGVDLITERHNLLEKCIRHNLVSWSHKPSPTMVPMMCCGCRLAVFRGLLKCAREHEIPIVVLGSGTVRSRAVERSLFKDLLPATNAFGKMASITGSTQLSTLCGVMFELVKNPRYLLDRKTAPVCVQEYFYFLQLDTIARFFYPKQKLLYLYEYVTWDESIILSTIRKELGWIAPASSTSSWRSDCEVSLLKNHLLKKTIGFTEKDEILSNMIREGMITREEALRRLERENIIPHKELSTLLDKIGFHEL
jgi:hypothetical protein